MDITTKTSTKKSRRWIIIAAALASVVAYRAPPGTFLPIGFDCTGTVRDKDIQNLCNPATQKLVRIKISVYYAFKKTQPPYLDLVPMIKRLFDAFGPDRLMWASDCPYQLTAPSTYAAPIAIVRHRLDFVSADDRRKLLRTTAESKFFFTVKK